MLPVLNWLDYKRVLTIVVGACAITFMVLAYKDFLKQREARVDCYLKTKNAASCVKVAR